jgi:hypothetical protein
MTDMWLPPTIVDMTAKTAKSMRVLTRKPLQIDCIVLHQTAFSRGNDPQRYLDVHAHFVVLPNGVCVQLHPLESYLVASSAFNNDAISIEFVGNFADDRGHWWQGDTYGRHVPPDVQISEGYGLVRYLKEQTDQFNIGFIFAHRQGEAPDLRGNCPGPDIWYGVGEAAVRSLGLDDGGKGYTEGRGGAIPDSWRRARDKPLTVPGKK